MPRRSHWDRQESRPDGTVLHPHRGAADVVDVAVGVDHGADRSISTSIVYALAEVADVDPTDLPFSLHDHIDTDALDALFSHQWGLDGGEDTRFSIELAEWLVTIRPDGHIVVTA